MAGRSARGRRGAELWQIGVSFQRIASMSLEKRRACRAFNAATPSYVDKCCERRNPEQVIYGEHDVGKDRKAFSLLKKVASFYIL